jgi:hypothetical protein
VRHNHTRNPIEVVHISVTPRNLEERIMLVVEFPVALVEMIGDFVRLWWRDRK